MTDTVSIKSILDTDLYKLTMQKAVLNYKQNVPVRYVFNNRRPEGRFNDSFKINFEKQIKNLSNVKLEYEEEKYLQENLPWLGNDYIQYLKNYRFDPRELNWEVKAGELNLEIQGSWERTILWEVPLMAIISETYFKTIDTNWNAGSLVEDTLNKRDTLHSVAFNEFGTRRRRSYSIQSKVVEILSQADSFAGTSNVHFAMKYGAVARGTMAHEWIMGISALEGLRHSNRHALNIWNYVYKGNLGIALTDTYGSEAFFNDFDSNLARTFDGVRHDSGCPYEFAKRTIKAYNDLKIDPKSKIIVFSDGLDPETAVKIHHQFNGMIKIVFGIGTNFTNDFKGSKALNMVIKLKTCNGVPVVKLSDNPSKAIGDPDAVRVAKWTFFNKALDQ